MGTSTVYLCLFLMKVHGQPVRLVMLVVCTGCERQPPFSGLPVVSDDWIISHQKSGGSSNWLIDSCCPKFKSGQYWQMLIDSLVVIGWWWGVRSRTLLADLLVGLWDLAVQPPPCCQTRQQDKTSWVSVFQNPFSGGQFDLYCPLYIVTDLKGNLGRFNLM